MLVLSGGVQTVETKVGRACLENFHRMATLIHFHLTSLVFMLPPAVGADDSKVIR